ncbi:MAG: O-antigen ligase family protein [Elainellaceae cyanobacterium]
MISNRNIDSEAKSPTSKAEAVITVLFILYFSQAFAVFPVVNKLFAALTYLFLPYIVLSSFKRYTYFLTRDIFILLLILLAGISILWSEVPILTFHNFRGMLRLAAYGIYFSMRHSLASQLNFFSIAFGISAISGVIISAVIPISDAVDGWRGSFPHKNDAARVMILSILTQLAIFKDKNLKRKIFNYVSIIMSFILLIFAKSSTALVVLLIMALIFPFTKLMRQRYRLRVVITTALIFALTLGSFVVARTYVYIITEILGEDLTLNGRTDLWLPLIERVQEKFWLGFGYNAFWITEFDWVASTKKYGADWTPTHAHSGFLDLTLSLGIIGLFLFTISFVRALIKSVDLIITSRGSKSIWILQFLVFVFIYNLNITQSILSPENIVWMIYISIVSTMLVPSKRKLLLS